MILLDTLFAHKERERFSDSASRYCTFSVGNPPLRVLNLHLRIPIYDHLLAGVAVHADSVCFSSLRRCAVSCSNIDLVVHPIRPEAGRTCRGFRFVCRFLIARRDVNAVRLRSRMLAPAV